MPTSGHPVSDRLPPLSKEKPTGGEKRLSEVSCLRKISFLISLANKAVKLSIVDAKSILDATFFKRYLFWLFFNNSWLQGALINSSTLFIGLLHLWQCFPPRMALPCSLAFLRQVSQMTCPLRHFLRRIRGNEQNEHSSSEGFLGNFFSKLSNDSCIFFKSCFTSFSSCITSANLFWSDGFSCFFFKSCFTSFSSCITSVNLFWSDGFILALPVTSSLISLIITSSSNVSSDSKMPSFPLWQISWDTNFSSPQPQKEPGGPSSRTLLKRFPAFFIFQAPFTLIP